ncbi:MAG: hydroxyacid dehydrogenase [Actinomycetota bacterium]|nr:hydroxyacid dehydrogenase [Actinomycetota bacterium]
MDSTTFSRVFPERAIDRLRGIANLGAEPLIGSLTADTAAARLSTVDILVTGWGSPRIDGSVLELAPRLTAIVHAGGSVKGHLDPVCWHRGISVSSAVAANAIPVAEYTAAMIVLANKQVLPIIAANLASRQQVDGASLFPAMGNYRKRVGIVGASRIGRLVIGALAGTDLELVVADPYLTAEQAKALGAGLLPLDELVSSSDVVSIHAPDLPETHHLLDARRIALLRPGATVINTARAALIDTPALIGRLRGGDIFAILDLVDPDPLPADSELWELPTVVLTPHLAGSMGTELERLADTAIDEVARIAAGEPLLHAVAADLTRSA